MLIRLDDHIPRDVFQAGSRGDYVKLVQRISDSKWDNLFRENRAFQLPFWALAGLVLVVEGWQVLVNGVVLESEAQAWVKSGLCNLQNFK